MKPTLLFVTLSMVLAAPSTFAKSELETLRSRCSEQERQIRQLEDENMKLRSPGGRTEQTTAAMPAAAAAAKPNGSARSVSTYTVKAGDCLEKIARKVGATSAKLAKSNGLKTSSIIRPGQKLKVPGTTVAAAIPPSPKGTAKTRQLQAVEAVSSISKKHGMPPSAPALAASPTPAAAVKSPAPTQNIPVSTAAPASSAPETNLASAPAKQPVAEQAPSSPNPDKKIRPVTIEGEMTYGEFATRHGTDAERLNALNGLDLTTATVLAKGSELYIPAQP